MSRARITCIAALAFVLATGTALASWYDDYDAGLAAAQKGQWQTVVQRMSAAIKGNPKEDNKAREYGTIFINYHPYYYRGVAYLNTGKFEQAIADFEKTQGAGDTDLGSLDTLMQRAKTRLAESTAPEPQPAQAAHPAPQPAAPAAPVIDPALRQRVAAAIGTANGSLANARGRNAAGSPQYGQAMSALAEANTKLNTAKNNDDLDAALAAAQNAAMFADSAVAPAAVAQTAPRAAAPAPAVHAKPVVAADVALSDYRSVLRTALTSYFNGEFDDASHGFEQLTRAMPSNAWIWAFLGASRYSEYAFGADEGDKQAAVEAFRKAKSSPHFRNGLPQKYFSKRIRKFFASLG